MAKFLNTQGISEWIPKIIDATDRELVIITPYMQLSDKIYECLFNANARGVETTLVYRENKLNEKERQKLMALDNLNLMHHYNLHAKCFYNEHYLLIGSMNLYEYSEKNNREMGVLFRGSANNDMRGDDPEVFEDALKEIVEIQNGAFFEKMSRETVALGFEMEILKTQKEKALERLKHFNKIFIHKKFEFAEIADGLNYNHYTCKSYLDKVDVKINHRIEFCIQSKEQKINTAFNSYVSKRKDMEYQFEGFKFYWNFPEMIYLYEDSKHPIWKKVNTTDDFIRLKKKGIDEVVVFIRKFVLEY